MSTKPVVLLDGKEMREILLRIDARDARGRPTQCTIVHDDSHVHLQGGEHFVRVYGARVELDPQAARQEAEDAAAKQDQAARAARRRSR